MFFLIFYIPYRLNKFLDKYIKFAFGVVLTQIILGLSIAIVGLAFPVYIFDYIGFPTKTKAINNEYYFEQQDYGMAFTDDGTLVDIYLKRPFWFDKKVGHIDATWIDNDLNAEIINTNNIDFKRLIIKSTKDNLLDTILNFKSGFDFKYISSK